MATKSISFLSGIQKFDFKGKEEECFSKFSIGFYSIEGQTTREMLRDFLAGYNHKNTMVIKIMPRNIGLTADVVIEEIGSLVK